jgi:hypothetical protein
MRQHVLQIGTRSVEEQLSFVENQQAITHTINIPQDVRTQQDGFITSKLLQQVQSLHPTDRIEPGGGFIPE